MPSGKYHVLVETVINAPIEKVWEIMTNLERYPQWNRFIIEIVSSNPVPVPGTQMKFRVQFPGKNKARSGELVKVLNPPSMKDGEISAEWIYDFTGPLYAIGMVRATRLQKLTAISPDMTHYYTCEKFSGWGKIFLPLKNVRAGFKIHAEDLKSVCEEYFV